MKPALDLRSPARQRCCLFTRRPAQRPSHLHLPPLLLHSLVLSSPTSSPTHTHTHSHALTCTHKHTRRGRERRGRAASLRGVRTPTARTAAPPPLCGGLQALNRPPNCYPNRHANSALVLHGLSTTDGQQPDEFGDKTSQKLSCNAQECISLLFNSRERLFLFFI